MLTTEEYVVSEVAPKQWDRVLRRFPKHTVFHTMPWLRTISECHGGLRLVLAQAECNGQCQAVWPCMEVWKGPLRVIGSPLPGWNTAYMGPLFRPGADVNAILAAFFEDKLLCDHAYFHCKVLNTGPDVDLTPYGFVPERQFDTYCIDLTLPIETLWGNLKSECRTRIRKAGKLDIKMREEETPEFLDEYWVMATETFAVTGLQPPFTRQFLDEMWTRLHPQGNLRALSAWHDGERVATLMLPLDDHTMYFWGGGSYFRFRALPAHNMLHWEAIKLAHSLGLRRYDFISTLGGAGRFKKTFGPEITTMATHWERTQSRVVSVLKKCYEMYLMKRRQLSKAAMFRGGLLYPLLHDAVAICPALC